MRRRREVSGIDFRKRVTVPVRDWGGDPAMPFVTAPVAFLVDVYGVEPSDLTTIGGDVGARPMMKAVTRLRLDASRYRATIWDVPV